MTDDEKKCSVCGDPATYEIEGADPSKGNLSCECCMRFWPLSNARRIDRDEA